MPLNSYFPFGRRIEFFDGLSATSSTYTSTPYFTGDFAQMSLSWTTSDAQTSRLTLQGSNEHGLTASLTTWSNVTAITAQGIFAVEPGMRWLRCLRASDDSLGEVYLQARM